MTKKSHHSIKLLRFLPGVKYEPFESYFFTSGSVCMFLSVSLSVSMCLSLCISQLPVVFCC